ncbi:MAG: cellulase family glycosylhydrolase [Sedimentisphaerales bacterium]|nr:cellulase family glycosylhydrolase [Sedimentisphaerales bacterium]
MSRKRLVVCLLLFVVQVGPGSVGAKGFLRTQGQDMVGEHGNKVLLRGVGLGNWLLPEGYMWKFGDRGDRPRRIEKIVSDLIGPEQAERFWLEFRKHYITEADIARIAELGFNSVRPALNARRFLTEGDNPQYVDEGFELLDNLVTWCKKYDVYVIIDMHGAPGGQTGANIDDSPNDRPELFMDPKNQDRLVELWVKIAQRYKDEPTVAAYDLLNEPLPGSTGAKEKYEDQLEPLYKRITAAIRRVDSRHMITLEGADWANDWSVFSVPFDDNVFYQFHYYCWDRPDTLKGIDQFLSRRSELNRPVWVGETGEKENTIYWGTTQYFETHNIGWSFWPWKKMDTTNTPYSIERPSGWDQIVAYSRGQGKPSAEVAQKAFDELIENIKLENCVCFPDVVNAIFRRIPGKIEAENYGHRGPGQSYSVKDPSTKSQYYRTSEPVPVVSLDGADRRPRGGQCIRLSAGEWTAYEFNNRQARQFHATVRAKADTAPAIFEVTSDGAGPTITLSQTGWQEIDLGSVDLVAGQHRATVEVLEGTVFFDWLQAQ